MAASAGKSRLPSSVQLYYIKDVHWQRIFSLHPGSPVHKPCSLSGCRCFALTLSSAHFSHVALHMLARHVLHFGTPCPALCTYTLVFERFCWARIWTNFVPDIPPLVMANARIAGIDLPICKTQGHAPFTPFWPQGYARARPAEVVANHGKESRAHFFPTALAICFVASTGNLIASFNNFL